jgi:hypothetical protein
MAVVAVKIKTDAAQSVDRRANVTSHGVVTLTRTSVAAPVDVPLVSTNTEVLDMINSNSRRSFLKTTGVSATALGSIPLLSSRANAYSIDLKVEHYYDDDTIEYVIEVDTPNCTKESKANSGDSVYNYTDYSRIEGQVQDGGVDTYSHDGRIRYLEVYSCGASIALRVSQSNTTYDLEGTVDITADGGDVYTDFYTTGMVCGTGSGSLEAGDSYDKSEAYGDSGITGGGHDKFDINGALDQITMEVNGACCTGYFDVNWGEWLQD